VGMDSLNRASTEASKAMEHSKAMGTRLLSLITANPLGVMVNNRAMARVMGNRHNLNLLLHKGHQVAPLGVHHQVA